MVVNTPKQFVAACKKHGSVKAVARQEKITYHAARRLYLQAIADGLMETRKNGGQTRESLKLPVPESKPTIEGRVKALKTPVLPVPATGTRRFLFTCAQNNTKVHMPLWENLLALAAHYGAEIHVSRFTYIKRGLGARGDKAKVVKKGKLYDGYDLVWDPTFEPYLSDERLEVAPGLVWCGEMNILPTAVRPLSGLEVYTGRKSGIFPHVKLAMESIPSGKHEPTKFNYTTGTVTQRNYIQRKAGLKAEFHHCYGALLVEVDSDGDWFCRQINADSAGTIYDLDLQVKRGVVTSGHRVEAITWGDIHVAILDPDVKGMAWANEDSMIKVLRPKYQFLHDVVDFQSRSHHEMKDPHSRFLLHVRSIEDVRSEIKQAAFFLRWTLYEGTKSIVVDSNHHHHLGRWLKEQDARWDPVNAVFWLDMQRRVYGAIQRGQKVNYLRMAIDSVWAKDAWGPMNRIRFLDEDESFVICPDASGGIECGSHGDLGPNGARGNPKAFARMGRKGNRGHRHSCGIEDGEYTSGTCSILNPRYARGPGSWSQSHIITYPNGKRTIVTCWNRKWRARS